MAMAVADTGPLRYLVPMGEAKLLPALFEKVSIPESVAGELAHRGAPEIVRAWIASPPDWLRVVPDPAGFRAISDRLGDGERAAIVLAAQSNAAVLLVDDRAAVKAATELGLSCAGTLGILIMASSKGLVDLSDAFRRLSATNFRVRPEILAALLRHPSA